jgi:DNA-binding transcriptional MerR regulator
MGDKSYSLAEVSEILHISPDTIYKWENQMPQIKPRQSEGGRRYDEWELDLLRNTKRFFFTYNQEIRMTRVAVERWISKNPRPHLLLDDPTPTTSASIEALKTPVSRRPATNRPARPISSDAIAPVASTNSGSVSQQGISSPSSPHLSATSTPVASGATLESVPVFSPPSQTSTPALSTSSSPIPSSPISTSSSTRSVASSRTDSSEVQTWKRAFNQTQTELNETKTELLRARENLQKQHVLIKHLQADFNAIKELIRKEVYDLRDLIVDNQ